MARSFPPLRQREQDIQMRFLRLLKQMGREQNRPVPRIRPGDLEILGEYPFTGNVRELHNVVERVWALRDGDVITRADLAAAVDPPDLDLESGKESAVEMYLPDEKTMIRQALAQCRGNQTRAARLLGIDRSTLWRKMKKYGLRQSEAGTGEG